MRTERALSLDACLVTFASVIMSTMTFSLLLDSILRTTQDQELQEKAVFALAQHGSPHAAELLRAYAERADAPTEVRAKAIFWLGQRHSADNAAYLRALYP